MHVRDAREADADALAVLADAPTDVMRNLVHDRTVRVAEDEAAAATVDASNGRFDGSDPEDILGFVSFDARDDVVYVTQLDGTPTACRRLIDEPVAFAEHESMSVEAIVSRQREIVTDALADRGFARRGRGPRFEGTETVRFRLEP